MDRPLTPTPDVPWILRSRPWLRRGVTVVALIALLLLAVLPREHLARVKVLPPQGPQTGLGSLLQQLGGLAGFAALAGGRQPTEVYLLLMRSNDVAEEVLRRLPGTAPPDHPAPRTVQELSRVVDIHALRGGVIEVEAVGADAPLLPAIVTAYAGAFQARLTELAQAESGRKRQLMSEKLKAVSEQLARAEQAMTRLRTSRRIASAEGQLQASVGLLANLRARLQAKEVELNIAQQFVTSQNFTAKRIEAEVTSLRKQLHDAEQSSARTDPFGFATFASESSEYARLYRDLKYAEALFEVYSRFAESIAVEDMSSSLNAQVIESPHLEPGRRYRRWALGLAGLLALGALLIEWRGWRPGVWDVSPD